MNSTPPTKPTSNSGEYGGTVAPPVEPFIHTTGEVSAKILFSDWYPKDKEENVFFKCGHCRGIFDKEANSIMVKGIAKCPYCFEVFHMSVDHLKAVVTKLEQMRKHS